MEGLCSTGSSCQPTVPTTRGGQFAVGEALARQCDAPLELLEVVTYPADVKRAEQLIRERLADTPLSVPATACARVMQRSVGFTIADHVANVNGGMLVMSTSDEVAPRRFSAASRSTPSRDVRSVDRSSGRKANTGCASIFGAS